MAKRIEKGDFVEMEELLPELWPVAHQESEGKVKKNQKIADIFTWTQCFALHSSVCAQHNPEVIAKLMAYMVSIVQVSREYSGLGWVQYNALFQKHAAVKADTKWSVINTTLYARCFTGAPREVVRCELCWPTSHDMKDCSYLAGADSTIEFRVQTSRTLCRHCHNNAANRHALDCPARYDGSSTMKAAHIRIVGTLTRVSHVGSPSRNTMPVKPKARVQSGTANSKAV